MKLLVPIHCLALAVLCLSPAAPAHAQSGVLLKSLNVRASKLLVDPSRPRLYAMLPQDSGIAVVDTNTNSVIETITVDADPADFSISYDGSKLYVVSNGSTQTAITVIDLQSLTVVGRLPLPVYTTAIAAGLGGRLYALINTDGPYYIAQLDASTGVLQGYVGEPGDTGFLRLSPDGKTLYYANAAVTSYAFLESFDVATASSSFVDANGFDNGQENTHGITISHNGKFLVCPIGTGNGAGGEYMTSLIPTADINSVLGTFDNGEFPGPATFSADDSLLYQIRSGVQSIQIFSTSSFALVDSFPFVHNDPIDVAVTPTHGYVYVSAVDDNDDDSSGPLRIFGSQPPPFFDGSVALTGGFSYLKFGTGVPFGYYSFASSPYLYHVDLGFEYPFDAADGSGGIYLYDFTSSTFWYTSSSLFPYLYDFTLNAWLYYYPDPTRPDHYNTGGVRYFYDFSTGKIIKK